MSTFNDLILVTFFPLGISDSLFRNNSNDNKNAVYSNKEDFFTTKRIISLMNNFYSAGVIQRFCRMKGDVSLGKKIRDFDFKLDLVFHQEFFRSTRFLACTRRFHNKCINNLGQNPKALVYGWRQILTLMIKISSFNAQISANKLSFFELTIEE